MKKKLMIIIPIIIAIVAFVVFFIVAGYIATKIMNRKDSRNRV